MGESQNDYKMRVDHKLQTKNYKLVIGIDEAGRGPLAGPMVIAAVSGVGNRDLRGIRDSKQLTHKAREEWFRLLKKKAVCRYVAISHRAIDRDGLTRVAKGGIAKLLRKFAFHPDQVLLDGSLFAPPEYRQRTIIKGDERVPIIAAASIIAKVIRDRMMVRLHKKYPAYNFATHKGYGTKAHFAAIRQNGLSAIHRRRFCTRIF